MYRIIKQNNSLFRRGEHVHDYEYLKETRELLAEGATPAVAEFLPNFRVSVHDQVTGEILESKLKFRNRESALVQGISIARGHAMGSDAPHVVIRVTEDSRECLRAEITGTWGPY